MHHLKSAWILVVAAGACTHQVPAPSRQDAPAAAAVQQPTAAAQPLSADAHAVAFDRADRRARSVIAQIRCAQGVSTLRREGAFGPVDSLGSLGHCATVDGRRVGAFYDTDTSYSRVERIAAVDFVTRQPFRSALDTAGILATGRASRDAQRRGAAAYAGADRPYAPMAIRFDGDSIEVWLVPTAVLGGPPLTVGGERGYVFTPDGRTLVRQVDAFDDLRTFALPDTGVIRIPAREAEVPGLTPMMLANLLHDSGRQVAIETARGTALLVGEGRAAAWVHLKD